MAKPDGDKKKPQGKGNKGGGGPRVTAETLAPVIDEAGFSISIIVMENGKPAKGKAVVFYRNSEPVSQKPEMTDQNGLAKARIEVPGGFKAPVVVRASGFGAFVSLTVNPPKAEKSKGGKDRRLRAEQTGDDTELADGCRIYQYFFLLRDENGKGVAGDLEFSARPAPGVTYTSVSNSRSLSSVTFWGDHVSDTGVLKAVIKVTKFTKVDIVIAGWPDDILELRLDGPRPTPSRRFFEKWQ